MTANDVDDKPDFAGRRIPRALGAQEGGAPAVAMTGRRSYTPTADEQAEMDAIFFGE